MIKDPTIPTDGDIQRVSALLSIEIRERIGDVAAELLGWDTRQTHSSITGPVEAHADQMQWHLTELRICRAAGLDSFMLGAVMGARAFGATWEQIGESCGVAAQAAQERWGPTAAILAENDRQ